MELRSDIYSSNRFNGAGLTGVFAPLATNSGYTAFSKWPLVAISIFLGTPTFNIYSQNSKCNTSKFVHYTPLIIFFLGFE